MSDRQHWRRMLSIWLVLALAADLLIWLAGKPHLPPGDMTDSARHQQFDIAVLAVIGAPVAIAVWLYFIYSLVAFRVKPGEDGQHGEPSYGNAKVQAGWIIGTTVIVLFAFAFGTEELIGQAGAGAGEGPNPIWKLAGKVQQTWQPKGMLEIQAIGQQWTWAFRYPQFGGMETAQLVIPVGTPIEFHVTSLDVVHSFWAYQLGVKADANPAVDNIAYTTARQVGSFRYECDELCGIWHGAMYNYGHVVTVADFQKWMSTVRQQEQGDGLLAALPPYARTYDPTVIPQLGKGFIAAFGNFGANGAYYPPTDPGAP